MVFKICYLGYKPGGVSGLEDAKSEDSSWSGKPLSFPLIQGADVYGEIAMVGSNVNPTRVGESVLVRTMQENPYTSENSCWTLGSECNGGFAQYTAVRSSEAFLSILIGQLQNLPQFHVLIQLQKDYCTVLK